MLARTPLQIPTTNRRESPLARVAFKMRLKPGNEVEYRRRHDEIWPELSQLLNGKGVHNYSIFRDGLDLFAYLEAEDPAAMAGLPQQEIMRKWWSYMEPLMECNADASPVVIPLEEVFHLD